MMLLPPAAIAEEGLFGLFGVQTGGTPVEQLARTIDRLEKHIDQNGSIVIKTPDVWGESRLMRHRSDVENQLKARLGAFDFRINAVQATRDAAFLATAVALQEQIATTPTGANVGPLTSGAATGATSVNAATTGMIADPNATNLTGVTPRTLFLGQNDTGGMGARTLKINIEPVIELDQMNRYLQHLNELRRLNEGDDNSDTPGYALNLIRIPVSVLPGRRTEQGFGAEVQITVDPYLNDEILPLAFKDFVINGIVDRIGYDVFQTAMYITGPELNPTAETPELDKKSLKELIQYSDTLKSEHAYNLSALKSMGWDGAPDTKDEAELLVTSAIKKRLMADVNHRDTSMPASHHESVDGDTLHRIAIHAYNSLVIDYRQDTNISEPVPPSHRVDHGLTMPEVSTLLSEESKAAYDFLSQPSMASLWGQYCTPDLARRVREHRTNTRKVDAPALESVAFIRRQFFDEINVISPEAHFSVTDALAWQIIVESALVNERLITDMRETATLKNCQCIPTDCMSFAGPNPPVEARQAFSEYVRCKWPIHVFALDPVTQDQNVSDSFSQRREMQMAMAIAASSRMLGGQAMSRFVRRMEYDLETIQLNRTAVAFSHGDNTFGWRFYPRVQAPPVPSNLSAITHDLLIGGQDRNKLLNTYRLEPGIRECTALVVMPSFVPQVMVDVRSDWFRLAKHVPFHPFNKRKPDHEDSMELSKQLTNLRCLQTQCMNDAHLYRDGDVYRLCKAVERLEDRLPMQTHNVPVPWENDLGGFEIFQSGTQVLGPEIHGWYGAPGITAFNESVKRNALSQLAMLREIERQAQDKLDRLGPDPMPAPTTPDPVRTAAKLALTNASAAVVLAKGEYESLLRVTTDTAVFLVGKNFSVLNCRVIAGGVDVTETIQVINRNLLQVRIPSTVSTVATSHTGGVDQKFVVVHLATPYGATSRLLIPVADNAEASDAGKALEIAKVAKTTADIAKTTADGAKTAAEAGQAKAKAVSDQFPAKLSWGETDQPHVFVVQGYLEEDGFEKVRFCPIKTQKTDLSIHQSPDGSFLEKSEEVDGQLLVFVKFPGNDKRKVGPWKIEDGDFENGKLTAGTLFATILNEIRDEIPCEFDPAVVLEVTGYVRFDDNPQHILKLEKTIKFTLKTIPKPED